jgi:hypothetical protein
MSTRYVQHVSGQGEKWQVASEKCDPSNELFWTVTFPFPQSHYLRLPKSEYRLCEPPERWMDVTDECEAMEKDGVGDQATIRHNRDVVVYTSPGSPYRLRKVLLWKTLASGCLAPEQCWAFLVEKREP